MNQRCDTHCHLYLEEFADDLSVVLARAKEAGIGKILVPGIDAASSQQAIALSQAHSGWLYAAVGIHPNYAKQVEPKQIAAIDDLLKANNGSIKAIGEIGLDYYRTWSSHEDQQYVFKSMLELAARYRLPVCIHIREAEADVLKFLEPWIRNLQESNNPLRAHPGVFHSFSGNAEVADWAIAHNFLMGISGTVTFKNAQELRDRIAEIAIDHLISETDSPYLAPHPHRGKRNEPAFVALVIEEIARTLDMEVEETAQQLAQNAQLLLDWDGF